MANNFYNGNRKLKKAGVHQEMTPHEQAEFARCRADPIYFCKKYVKIVDLDNGIVNFNMWDFQEEMMKSYVENRFVINLLPRQMGKALPLDTRIPTQSGWSTIYELKIGDYVIGRDGQPTKVISKSEVFTNRKCYKFILDDNSEIVSDSQHLWNVAHRDWGHSEKTLSTDDIIKLDKKSLYINAHSPVELNEIELPIDPYTLGCWLGDGSSYHGVIYGQTEDMNHIIDNIPYDIISNNEYKNDFSAVRFKGLHSKIKESDLYKNKHIPKQYLRASIKQRIELLRGLMDTDGYCEKNGRCEFSQKSKILIDNVYELLKTLGIKCRINSNIIDGIEYYKIGFCTELIVFNLPRKRARQANCKNHPKNTRLYIKDIIEVDSVDTQCITVDNHDSMFLCGESMIPTHNSITTVAFCLHTAIFKKHQQIGVLANKAATARKILQQAQRMYENLPFFLQVGVEEWNKGSVEFGNGSSIIAESGNSDAVRGFTFNTIVLDEFAFLENAEEFYTSTYPVISSGSKSKVIIISTPNGMNLFYKMWEDAKAGRNEFKWVEVNWWQHPRRDEKWAETARKNMGKRKFGQEFGNQFHGSSGTLISGEKLAALTWKEPIKETESIKVYEKPQASHSYLVTVDVSEGVGGDHSVINVTDITQQPYRQVCVFRNNETAVLVLPEVVERIATEYNEAFILVETNSIGAQVSNILYHDYEYENMIVSATKNQENFVSGGFSSTAEIGIRMTKKSKRIGCTNIKALIENDLYIVQDFQTIQELQTFVAKGQSYEAEDGKHDDIVMTLVALGWLSTQDYFKDLMDVDNRAAVLERQIQALEDDITPAGFFNNADIDRLNSEDGDIIYPDSML